MIKFESAVTASALVIKIGDSKLGTIWEKTGIFGLGKKILRHICDRCSKDITYPIEHFPSPKPSCQEIYCRTCAIELGINLQPHDWPSDEELFQNSASWVWFWMRDKKDGKEKFIKNCSHCSGLLVGIKNGSMLSRFYYEVGSATPKSKEFKCNRKNRKFIDGHFEQQLNCLHSFICMATSREDGPEARALFRELKESPANQYMQPIDHEAAAFGRKYVWCSQCGLFYDLPCYRENELLNRGINKDWYV